MKTILLLAACLLVAPAMTVHGSEPGVAADARAPVEETGATAGTTPRASAAQPETARQPAEAAPASEGGEGGADGDQRRGETQLPKDAHRGDLPGCLVDGKRLP